MEHMYIYIYIYIICIYIYIYTYLPYVYMFRFSKSFRHRSQVPVLLALWTPKWTWRFVPNRQGFCAQMLGGSTVLAWDFSEISSYKAWSLSVALEAMAYLVQWCTYRKHDVFLGFPNLQRLLEESIETSSYSSGYHRYLWGFTKDRVPKSSIFRYVTGNSYLVYYIQPTKWTNYEFPQWFTKYEHPKGTVRDDFHLYLL